MRFHFIAPAVLALAACAAPEPQPVVALSGPERHARGAGVPSGGVSRLEHDPQGCAPKQTDAQRAEVQAEIANQLHTMGTHSLPKSD